MKSDLLLSASVSAKNQHTSVSFKDKNPPFQSKSKKLYDSVESVNPLAEGFIHAGDVEDAFRVSYVDFQQDFMEELKDLFFNKFSIELSQIKADIASIKQHQARHAVSSNEFQALKNENMALQAEIERLRRVNEMKTKVETPPSLNKQISKEFEAKRELFPSTSQHNADASREGGISEKLQI